jgi:hypothetical protein
MNKPHSSKAVFCIIAQFLNPSPISGRVDIAIPEKHILTAKPSDYNFARKVTAPCGDDREYLDTVAKDEVINMIEMLHDGLNHIKSKTPDEHCAGMTLSTLPPQSPHGEQIEDLHLYLSSLLSHLYLLKLDWVSSQGPPCQGHPILTKLYTKIVTSWQVLTCVFIRSVPLDKLHLISGDLRSNLKRVTETPINRYTNCQMRRTRDCVLMSQALQALNRLETFYAS